MNIGFDAAAFFAPSSKNRGIGNYSVSLFSTMINCDKSNNYFMLNCIDDTSFKNYLNPDVTNFNEDILYTGVNCTFANKEYSEIYGDIIRTFIEKNKIDVFIVTSPFEFIIAPYKKSWFGNTPVYCIVYDIIPYVMRDYYLRDTNTNKLYMSYLEHLKEFDRYLVISQSVKDDLVSYLKYDADRIDVIYGAFDSHFKVIEVSSEQKDALYSKFGVSDGFIMCTGGEDYRKNIDGLIEAYANLPQNLIKKHQLVIVCKMSDASFEKYTTLAKKLNISNRVVLTNFVSTEELIQFYNLAYLMAFPSKYEGFGLPVVEAWACETPVLTSNNSSLGEIAGEGAVLVDPFNVKDITRGLEYALTEADLEKLLLIGQERNKEIFNWKNVAKITLEAISKVKLPKKLTVGNKSKIAVFTPLTPLESGISDYSEDIIRSLSEYLDIDVFIDDGYNASCHFGDNVSVYNHKAYSHMRESYIDTLYQVGNSEYHVYMYDYIEKYSGTVVLHDFNMNGVALHLRDSGKTALYKKFVNSDFDGKDAELICSYGPSTTIPFNGIVVNPASKVIVHDKHSKKGLLERNFGKKIFVIPLYAKPERLVEETESLRNKYGYKNDDIIFAAFGIIAPTKRIMPIVNAFKDISDNIPNAKLLLCGKQISSMGNELDDFIKKHKLSDKINITGFIQLDEFVDYIDICDVCFNLRYPYNGESSGTLARILAKKKPVVVNRIGSFDCVPDEACIKLDSVDQMSESEEILSIYNIMYEYVKNPKKYIQIAENGRKYAEETLNIKKIAKQYLNTILSSQRISITRELVKKIKADVLKNSYTTFELQALAHTFAYAKNEFV